MTSDFERLVDEYGFSCFEVGAWDGGETRQYEAMLERQEKAKAKLLAEYEKAKKAA